LRIQPLLSLSQQNLSQVVTVARKHRDRSRELAVVTLKLSIFFQASDGVSFELRYAAHMPKPGAGKGNHHPLAF
jgi:hypothetical protein